MRGVLKGAHRVRPSIERVPLSLRRVFRRIPAPLIPALRLLFRFVVAEPVGPIIVSALAAHTA